LTLQQKNKKPPITYINMGRKVYIRGATQIAWFRRTSLSTTVK